jgi:cytoplasmic tRNA 2-thiolation protein 2
MSPFAQLILTRPVDPSALAWKSRTALTSLLKTPSSNGDEPRPRRSTLAPLLCYACLTTLTPALPRCISGDPVMLPPFIAEGVSQRREMVDREDMRAEIGQYILDDGNVAS